MNREDFFKWETVIGQNVENCKCLKQINLDVELYKTGTKICFEGLQIASENGFNSVNMNVGVLWM